MRNRCTGSYTPSAARTDFKTLFLIWLTGGLLHMFKSQVTETKKCDVIPLIKFLCVFSCGSKVIQSPYPRLKIGNKSQQVLHHAQVCLKDHLQNDQ